MDVAVPSARAVATRKEMTRKRNDRKNLVKDLMSTTQATLATIELICEDVRKESVLKLVMLLLLYCCLPLLQLPARHTLDLPKYSELMLHKTTRMSPRERVDIGS